MGDPWLHCTHLLQHLLSSEDGDGVCEDTPSGQYPAESGSCYLNTQGTAVDLFFLHVQNGGGAACGQQSQSQARSRRGWLLLGLSPLVGPAGERGCEFPFRLVAFHLNWMLGCWGVASGTFLGVTGSRYRGQTALLRISARKTGYFWSPIF